MNYELTRKTDLAILAAQRRDNPRAFALGAIDRLNAKRTGRATLGSTTPSANGALSFVRRSPSRL